MYTIIEFLRNVVGEAPEGFEYIEYIASLCIVIFIVRSILSFFTIFKNTFRRN